MVGVRCVLCGEWFKCVLRDPRRVVGACGGCVASCVATQSAPGIAAEVVVVVAVVRCVVLWWLGKLWLLYSCMCSQSSHASAQFTRVC